MMYRLPAVAGEWIDRSRTIAFEFEGRRFQGFAGDTISTALAAAGEMTLGRSFKYHRPRGIFSLANHDANNLFQIGRVPNVRGDVVEIAAGMEVMAVNTVGGLKHDRARFLEWLAPFMPVGWYYKAFHGKNFRRWEHRIRKASGLGCVGADAPRVRTPKRYAFCDVLVIGAGLSGLTTALSAADAGARVLLVDENARAGGCGAWTGAAAAEVDKLIGRVAAAENIEVLTGTYAAGVYADRWVALVEPARMTKVRAGAVVFATGVIEQPAVFRNNDLPGVMLGSAAQRLVRRYGIAPGKRVVLLTANREGYELARELRSHRIEVAAVLDLRAGFGGDAYGLGDLRFEAGAVPEAAIAGRNGAVRALRVRLDGDDSRPNSAETIECDAVLMSVGFAPASGLLSQSGAVMQYDMALQQHIPAKLPPGIFAAGRVNGIYEYAARRQDGRDAGAAAAEFARGGDVSPRAPRPESTRQVSHPYPVFAHPFAREFVDFDEDIQVKDLLESVEQGFDSTELMKRYSTLGMGPSQGKHSNLQGARILMRSRNATLADTALTTQRPFYHPVPLKHLAGMGFHPHRHSAVHEKHAALEANFMTVGGWQRPEYYRVAGQARAECIAAEVRAVREGAGIVDVSTLGKIEIFGPDAGAFLDRIYTGSFSDLRVGMTRYGLLLDEAGIVRDDGVIARLAGQHFYFTTTTGGAANVYRELLLWNTRWRMDCTFVNATGHRAAFNLAGPRSRVVLQALTDIDLSESAFPFLGMRQGRVAGVEARVLRAGFVSSLGFEVHVPYQHAAAAWDALANASGVRAFGVEAQRVLRLEKGHAIVAQDTDNLTNPFEAGLGWAVRMQKPFFVGQRSLRIHVRRGARQKLIGFELAPEQVASGAAIRESNLLIHLGGIAGRVTSVAQSPTLGRTIGLAMVAPHLATPGTPIVIRASDGRLVSARVSRTPFLEAE